MPEPPFVRVDELGGQFPGMPGAPSHGQNRGLAVGAADQAPRACDSAHGLTGKERAISRLAAPGSRVTSEPDPPTVSRSAPFIRSEPCDCRRVRGWDLVFESGLLQRRVTREPVNAQDNPEAISEAIKHYRGSLLARWTIIG